MNNVRQILPTAFIFLALGCSTKRDPASLVSVPKTDVVKPGSAEKAWLKNERSWYRSTVNKRLYQLEGEIQEARQKRLAEKSTEKIRACNRCINEKVLTKENFRQKLDELDNPNEQEWPVLKAEMDTLLIAADHKRTTNN